MAGTQRAGASKQNYHKTENWVEKAFHGQPPHDHHEEDQKSNLESSSAVSSTFSKQQPFQSKSPTTQRDRNWVPHNRRKHGSKQRFVKKSEPKNSISQLGSLNPEVGSSNSEPNSSCIDVDSSSCSENVNEEVRNKEEDDLKLKQEECESSIKECEENAVDDVVRRLEWLQLGVEEAELSEEQLGINDQLQVDEVLAMESIYGENVFILDTQSGRRCFQIHIPINTSRGLTVTAKLNMLKDLKMGVKSSDEFLYSFEVQYLPPIVLTCLLPKSYPSHLPPYFTISVQWLDSIRISNLCSKLDLLWIENSGQEVLYQWTEWLQNFSLSYLGVENEIMLGPYNMKHAGDGRAVQGMLSPDVDIPSLKSYNDQKHYENFCQSLHECCICYNEYAGSDFIRLPCKHFFCLNCMKTFSSIHVLEGTVNKLDCPDAKCGGIIPPSLLKQVLSDKEYERWESLLLQKTLESMSDVTYCPRCETPCIIDEDQNAQCSKCLFSFCTICWEQRHVGSPCLSPELKLRILEERQNSSLTSEQQRKERNIINQILSEKEIKLSCKLCPSCNMAISKTEGCNKMVCSNCRQYFCYQCNSAISGYDHFRNGECELFPQAMIEEWQQQMNAVEVRRVSAQNQDGFPSSCPYCGQHNTKVNNNNHIHCWACQRHYCHVCRQIVRRSSEHYGPKGCKQHTVG